MFTTYAKTLKVPETGLVNYKGYLYGVDSKFINNASCKSKCNI